MAWSSFLDSGASSNLYIKNTMLLLVDYQHGYVELPFFDQIVENGNKLLRAAEKLGLEIAISELRGKGSTADGLGIDYPKYRPDLRNPLSVVGPRLQNYLDAHSIESVLLGGIEVHKAIKETARDLRGLGINVYVVTDASTSEKKVDRQLGHDKLREYGCHLVTTNEVIAKVEKDYGGLRGNGSSSRGRDGDRCKRKECEPESDQAQYRREQKLKRDQEREDGITGEELEERMNDFLKNY